MAVSESPWWWFPEFVPGPTCAWPIQTFSEPTVFPDTASKRRMPLLWVVFDERSVPVVVRALLVHGRTLAPAGADAIHHVKIHKSNCARALVQRLLRGQDG